MKTRKMTIEALTDAREVKNNLFNSLMMLKQELSICGAQWNDTKLDCFNESIDRLESQYASACALVAHYEAQMKK